MANLKGRVMHRAGNLILPELNAGFRSGQEVDTNFCFLWVGLILNAWIRVNFQLGLDSFQSVLVWVDLISEYIFQIKKSIHLNEFRNIIVNYFSITALKSGFIFFHFRFWLKCVGFCIWVDDFWLLCITWCMPNSADSPFLSYWHTNISILLW